MSEIKVNTVNTNCPSFYKEKVKQSQKTSRFGDMIRRFISSFKGQK